MGSYDFFVGSLVCPVCGQRSRNDESTNMQTKIARSPSFKRLGVGDVVDFDFSCVRENEANGYGRVKGWTAGEELRVLELWECGNCGEYGNWAQIAIRDGTIVSIESVPLDREHLVHCHLFSEEVMTVLHRYGIERDQVSYSTVAAVLLDKL